MSDEEKGSQPNYIAYGVQEREGEKPQFHKIGSAIAHEDGKGHTISRQNQSIKNPDKIILREPKARLQCKEQGRETRNNDRGYER